MLDDESDKKLDRVSIFLTIEEAKQLQSYLNKLLASPETQHAHLSSNDYQKEITICLYDNKNFINLHPRAIKLIKEDK
mgnify:CR=1 FL=1